MNGKMILVLAICLAGIVLLSVLAAVLISRFLKKRQKYCSFKLICLARSEI